MRLIDADALYDFLTDQREKETGMYSKGRNVGLNIARSALHDKTITPTITPPPNDPLTLEELRKMGGEPVWVCESNGANGVWGLVDQEYQMIRLHGGGLAVWENNGKTWLAYRRKLEEVKAP